jgi:fused-like protein
MMFLSTLVGNAAFHSAELYGPLRMSIYPLLSALDDDDEKTRANAAGALGNLVRNSGDLAQALCDAGAIDRLLVMCLRESKIFPQVPL